MTILAVRLGLTPAESAVEDLATPAGRDEVHLRITEKQAKSLLAGLEFLLVQDPFGHNPKIRTQ